MVIPDFHFLCRFFMQIWQHDKKWLVIFQAMNSTYKCEVCERHFTPLFTILGMNVANCHPAHLSRCGWLFKVEKTEIFPLYFADQRALHSRSHPRREKVASWQFTFLTLSKCLASRCGCLIHYLWLMLRFLHYYCHTHRIGMRQSRLLLLYIFSAIAFLPLLAKSLLTSHD